ncbi:MAG: protein kinase [Myxococcales bacterium]|nr:protein kinase [Myxococcales bacterium]
MTREPARGRPIVGRESELDLLDRWAQAALRGERQVVLITGEPGIGKTTLIDAFLERLASTHPLQLASGKCIEHYGPGEAYLPLLEAAGRLCRTPAGGPFLEVLHKYAPTWLVQLPALMTELDAPALERRAQGATRERMLREMAEALEAFCAEHGTVLVLEDLHWSDVSTLEWLASMAQRREPAMLLVIGTYRPADVRGGAHPLRGIVQQLLAREQAHELPLHPLGAAAIERYLSERFEGAALDKLCTAVADRTGGNPLFMINMVEYLTQRGVMVEQQGRWTLHEQALEATRHGVPESLRLLIEAQIERLDAEDQRVLEVASVLGIEFGVASVATGLQIGVEEAEERCESLARRAQFIRGQGAEQWPDGTLAERYRFLHALYQEVFYARIREAQRVRLHARLAARKEEAYGERAHEIATELAVHFERGLDVPKALRYLKLAGDNAMRRSAHAEAIASLESALALLPRLPDDPARVQSELSLQVSLGAAFMAVKGYGAREVGRAYARARELSRRLADPRQHVRVIWGLWSFYYVRGEHQTAHELAEQCLSLAQQLEDPVRLMQAHQAVGTSLVAQGDFVAARAHLEEGIRLYDAQPRRTDALQEPGVDSRAYLALVLWYLGYPDQAAQTAREGIALAEERAHPLSLAFAQGGASWVFHYRGEPDQTLALVDSVIALSREQGLPVWLANSMTLRGWALAERGQVEAGLALSREAIAGYHATGVTLFYPKVLAVMAEMHAKLGQHEEGLRRVAEALAMSGETGERTHEAELYRVKGELLLAADRDASQDGEHTGAAPRKRVEQAEACFQRALEIVRPQRARSLELRVVTSLGRLWHAQGRTAEARALLADTLRGFTEGLDTRDLRHARALLAELGDAPEADPSPPDDRALDPPRPPADRERVGRYAVLDTLGRGSMGQVYEGFDDKLDRRLAIKVLHRHLSDRYRQRLVAEAQALARLSHPNVVQVYEVGEASGDTFVAMELVRGQTLRQWAQRDPRPGWRECVEIYLQAGEGLASAHAERLIHRDFKPGNAILDDKGRVRVLDFGLARYIENVESIESDDAERVPPPETLGDDLLESRMTQTGNVVGTPAYMPPEQMMGQELDARSDQFSFCVALYEAIYGERPFAGQSMAGLVLAIKLGHVLPPPRGTTVPLALRQVLLRGLASDPERRWPSMQALLDALREVTTPRTRARRGRVILGLLLAAALGLGYAYVIASTR